MARLENWKFTHGAMFAITSDKAIQLVGNVYDHPKEHLADGRVVLTSKVEFYSPEDNLAITHSGTRYELGKMDDAFAEYLSKNDFDISDFRR